MTPPQIFILLALNGLFTVFGIAGLVIGAFMAFFFLCASFDRPENFLYFLGCLATAAVSWAMVYVMFAIVWPTWF